MKAILFFIVSFLILPVYSTDTSLATLDIKRTKEGLLTAYRSFYLKPGSSWKVNWVGRTQDWIWNGRNWVCSNDGSFLNCAEWSPLILQWSAMKSPMNTLEPLARVGFEIGKPKFSSRAPAPVDPLTENFPDPNGIGTAEDENIKAFENKRWASEVWDFQDAQGERLKLYLSLVANKSLWIDRIDHGSYTELLEWSKHPTTKAMQIELIAMDNGRETVSFRPNKEVPPADSFGR